MVSEMNTDKYITHDEYMEDSSNLHHQYYLQFATEGTKSFVLNSLKPEDIKKALDNGDKYLNDIKIPYNNMSRGGGWWWDEAPVNYALIKQLGGGNSQSTHTCVAKAMAKEIANNLV